MPSVYAACEIQTISARSQPEISHTGPLYIAIRSLKHESSTAFTHGRDFDHVLELEEFAFVAKNRDQDKPIVLTFVDGGPDENPRLSKVLSVTINHFRKYKLDVYIVMTHALGISAYNYVERQNDPLNKALAGVVLDHDACGTHLDDSGRTINVELEKETSELPVRSWQIYGANGSLLKGRLLLNMLRTNDVIQMILINCGSQNIAEFHNICFRL